MSYLIGIDLGGTHIKMIGVSPEGQMLEEQTAPTDDGPGMKWAHNIKKLYEGFLESYGQPSSVGLCAPGLAATDAQSIAWMPGRLEGLEGLNWTDFIGSEQRVRVINDAHSALMGEVWQGAAQGSKNVVMITLGTGVGGAILCDGQLLKGHIGRAGSLGHICLDTQAEPDICNTPGSLEEMIGDCSIEARSGGRFDTTRALMAAHNAGDAEAQETWSKSVRHLACGLTSIINMVDPEIIVIGGGIANAEEDLFSPLQRELDQVEWRPGGHQVQLIPASLGDKAGAFGAAAYSMQEM